MGELTDNRTRSRFEMAVDGGIAFVNYRFRDSATIDLLYAKVPPALAGRGIGSRLAREVLDEARRRGLHVIASCGFIAAFIRQHPEFHDLIA